MSTPKKSKKKQLSTSPSDDSSIAEVNISKRRVVIKNKSLFTDDDSSIEEIAKAKPSIGGKKRLGELTKQKTSIEGKKRVP